MKPPTFKINDKYHIRYIQIPYDNRYYRIFKNNIPIINIPCNELLILRNIISGFASNMDSLEKKDLWRRFEKFKGRVESKDRILNKAES